MTPDQIVQTQPVTPTVSVQDRSCDETPRPGTLVRCDCLLYEEAWNLQRTCHRARAADHCRDLLLLMEHPPVFTAGRTTKDHHWPGEDNLTQRTGIPVLRTERGGSITYHGPGQVVGYPVLRLSDHCAGPKAYVRRLEDVLIATLAGWGIAGRRLERLPGVWIGSDTPSKIASIGVRISQGITTHGFALNVSVDLTPFSHIVPCGITDCRVTSMAALLGTTPDVNAVRQRIAADFAERFHLIWTETIGPERFTSLVEQPTGALVSAPSNAQFIRKECRNE
ncbi:MAG: octanoate-[acyl-carrier-protein]-protein-N-octanoyltransferase [Nitrospira sp.]|nr:MAG: octanoate-[acyl-carrier-protein]-protein-N-octanoyltransferase [Nitrospira sp.]